MKKRKINIFELWLIKYLKKKLKKKYTDYQLLELLIFKEKILDSFDILLLITDIEKKFKIKFKMDELNEKYFSNIKQIAKQIKAKKK